MKEILQQLLKNFMLPLVSNVLKVSLLSLAAALVIVALYYHSIFKPDYRPGGKSMPFIWFQMVRSVYHYSRKLLVLNKIYTLHALSGLCKILEQQKIFSFSICGKVYVFLFTPETAEVLLSSSKLIEKSTDYDSFRLLFRTGLFVSKGDLWKSRRKLLTPTFHFKILRDFTPLMQDASKSFMNKFMALLNEPWVDVNQIMRVCGFNMIIRTALGLNFEEEDDMLSILKIAEEFNAITAIRISMPWLYFNFIFNLTSYSKRQQECVKFMQDYVKKILEQKKMARATKLNAKIDVADIVEKNKCTSNGQKNQQIISNVSNNFSSADERTDEEDNNVYRRKKIFIDLLLDLHYKDPSFTEDDILDETIVFLGASTETLGSNLSFILYSIGLYKQYQKKIQEELDEIFQGLDRDIKEEDLKSMKYMDCVIKESLRLFSAAFFSREATESFRVFDYTVPQGSTVVLFTHVIHRDPKAFPNPEVFDPSRFFPENSAGRHPYAYIPFSAGPRNCIGKRFSYMTIKTIVAALLRKFDITSLDDRDNLYKNLMTNSNLTEIPVRIKFSLRNKN